MKKIAFMLLVMLSGILLISCTSEKEEMSDSTASVQQTSETTDIQTTAATTTAVTTATTTVTTKITVPEYVSDTFLNIMPIVEYNDYIYYLTTDGELCRCKLDLTDQKQIKPNVTYFYPQGSYMYFVITSLNGQEDMYYFNMDDESLDIKKIDSYWENENVGRPIIYNNKLISFRNDYKVDISEIDHSYVDYRTRDKCRDVSVMGEYLYYRPIDNKNGDYIMKFDMATGKGEEFCEIPPSEKFVTYHTYANKNIVFQTDYNAYSLLNTETMKFSEIEFDFSGYENGFSWFPFFDENNLYFMVSEDYDEYYGSKTPIKIFRYSLNSDNAQPEYIQDIEKHHSWFRMYIASNNCVYYYNYNNEQLECFALEN